MPKVKTRGASARWPSESLHITSPHPSSSSPSSSFSSFSTTFGPLSAILFLVSASATVALAVFTSAFFTSSIQSVPGVNTKSDLPPSFMPLPASDELTPLFSRMIFVVIDGARASTVFGTPEEPNMPWLKSKVASASAAAFISTATAPTVTAPRIKALMTGAVSSYVDVVYNFDADSLSSDSLMAQFDQAGLKRAMAGDDTWLALYPNGWSFSDPTTSFFVADTVTVDSNVTRNIDPLLKSTDEWDIAVLHYLGVDHIGHLDGPHSPLLQPKLNEMDSVISHLYDSIEVHDTNHPESLPSLLVVVSDHGMTREGNHGGSSAEEVDTLAIFLSPSLWSSGSHAPTSSSSSSSSDHNESTSSIQRSSLHGLGVTLAEDGSLQVPRVAQVDIPSTLALAFGTPIPRNSVGRLIPPIFRTASDHAYLRALQINADHLSSILTRTSPLSDELQHMANDAASLHKALLHGLRDDDAIPEVEASYLDLIDALSAEIGPDQGDEHDLYALGVALALGGAAVLIAVGIAVHMSASSPSPFTAVFRPTLYPSAAAMAAKGPQPPQLRVHMLSWLGSPVRALVSLAASIGAINGAHLFGGCLSATNSWLCDPSSFGVVSILGSLAGPVLLLCLGLLFSEALFSYPGAAEPRAAAAPLSSGLLARAPRKLLGAVKAVPSSSPSSSSSISLSHSSQSEFSEASLSPRKPHSAGVIKKRRKGPTRRSASPPQQRPPSSALSVSSRSTTSKIGDKKKRFVRPLDWDIATEYFTALGLEQLVLVITLILHSVLFFSSSFVEEEHVLVYYLSATVIIVQVLGTFFRPEVRGAWSAVVETRVAGVLMLLTLRVASSWHSGGVVAAHIPDMADALREARWDIQILASSGPILLVGAFAAARPWSQDWQLNTSIPTWTSAAWSFFYVSASLSTAIYHALRIIHHSESALPTQGALYAAWVAYAALGFLALLSALVPTLHFEAEAGWSGPALAPLFGGGVFWMLIVLIGRHENVPLYCLMALFWSQVVVVMHKREPTQSALWSTMGSLALFARAWFFAVGNSNRLTTVDVSPGYTGMTGYWFPVVSSLVLASTFAGPALASFVGAHFVSFVSTAAATNLSEDPSSSSSGSSWASVHLTMVLYVLYYMIATRLAALFFYCISLVAHRHHLFIWSVFAPKFLYEAFHTLVTFLELIAWVLWTLFLIYSRPSARGREAQAVSSPLA